VPGEFNAILEVNGFAEYAVAILPRDPIPPNPQFSLLLEMDVRADLLDCESGRRVGEAVGLSRDEFGYDDGDTLTLTKRYRVAQLCGGMWLNIAFRVTKDDVAATAMWLQVPKVVRTDEGN
jgi:hypothetical protein